MMAGAYRTDFDSSAAVSVDLSVVRWGRVWYVWARDGEDTARGSIIGSAHPSKAVAIAHALRYVERGEYA